MGGTLAHTCHAEQRPYASGAQRLLQQCHATAGNARFS